MAGMNVPFWWPLCGLIAMIYLAIAVKANEQPYQPYGYGQPGFYPQQQPFPPQPFPPQGYPPPAYQPPGYPPQPAPPTAPYGPPR
jgi:hypothetical protein